MRAVIIFTVAGATAYASLVKSLKKHVTAVRGLARGAPVRSGGAFLLPQPWHSVPIRALTIALCLFANAAHADVAGTASVIDGDTLKIHGQRMRFHGIVAPESGQLCRLDGTLWPCGEAATNALVEKIARRAVTCEDLGSDRYGRMIARCTVAGEDLEAWIVRNGWAPAYRRYSLDYVDEEADAQAAQHGIWASEFVKPWAWRRGEPLER